MNESAELVDRVLKLVSTLDNNEQSAYLAKGQAWCSLFDSEAWKGYNGCKTRREFIVDAGYKPSKVEACMRVTRRFGPLIEKESLSIVPSRLVKMLTIKHESPEKDLSMLSEMGIRAVPHSAFTSQYLTLKGQPKKANCDHIGTKRTWWTKCECGHWQEDTVR